MNAEESSFDSGFAVPIGADALQRKAIPRGSVEPAVLTLMRAWLIPLAVTASLGLCMLMFRQPPSTNYAALGFLAFVLSYRISRPRRHVIVGANGIGAELARRIQPGDCVDIDGMPVVSIFDTPFHGMRAWRATSST